MPHPHRSAAATCLLALTSVLLAARPSAAALTEIDDVTLPASPDGFNITEDDVTGLAWLDLTVAAGRTYDDIVGNDGSDELGPGGDFEGFRYATALEVTGWTPQGQIDSLYSNWGFNSVFSSIGPYATVRDAISYLGCFENCASYGFAQGIYVDDMDPSDLSWAMLEAFSSQGQNWGSLQVHPTSALTSRATNGSLDTTGHYLVREVPEPSGIIQLLAGGSLLAVLARRGASRGASAQRQATVMPGRAEVI